jgi:hypothetical protein
MMHRQLREVLAEMERLQRHLRVAIVTDDIRTMVREGGAAQQLTVSLATSLRASLDQDSDMSRNERAFLRAARGALLESADAAARVALGTNAGEVREELLMFKTHADFADAYLRAADGFEGE